MEKFNEVHLNSFDFELISLYIIIIICNSSYFFRYVIYRVAISSYIARH